MVFKVHRSSSKFLSLKVAAAPRLPSCISEYFKCELQRTGPSSNIFLLEIFAIYGSIRSVGVVGFLLFSYRD